MPKYAYLRAKHWISERLCTLDLASVHRNVNDSSRMVGAMHTPLVSCSQIFGYSASNRRGASALVIGSVAFASDRGRKPEHHLCDTDEE